MDFYDINKQLEQINPAVNLCRVEELRSLYNHVLLLPEKSNIVELGSYCGGSSYVLAQVARQIDSKLICVDKFKEGFDGQYFTGQRARDEWHRVMSGQEDVVTLIDKDTAAAREEYEKLFDVEPRFLFVDAGHEYSEVFSDLQNWGSSVYFGGYIALHDYNHSGFPGIKMAFDEFVRYWNLEVEEVDNVISMRTYRIIRCR